MERTALTHIVTVVDALIEQEAGAYYGDRTGVCDHINTMLALVARNLGYSAMLVSGTVDGDDAWHTWVGIEDVYLDLAGAQFGREQVRIFSAAADPGFHVMQVDQPGARTALYPEDAAIVQAATDRLRTRSI